MYKVVVSGTYHRDPIGLARLMRELEATGCRILSPLSIDFVRTNTAIVKAHHEQDFSAAELEKYHLRAIRVADFVWFHCPAGHMGASASFELGYAVALGKPVFCKQLPSDEMLRTQLVTVDSVFESLELINT